jgi:VIT1/CCC1 family predicted Fe2+/Mn2+ transporter
MSMAAGEFVSVSSQSDTERADLAREKAELSARPEAELEELAALYRKRGVDEATSLAVARQLMSKDALDAHAREELGIHELTSARPLQAAVTSALMFAGGALLPILLVVIWPGPLVAYTVGALSLVFLAALGALGASAGGAPMDASVIRVTLWGALAMVATYAVGLVFGAGPM